MIKALKNSILFCYYFPLKTCVVLTRKGAKNKGSSGKNKKPPQKTDKRPDTQKTLRFDYNLDIIQKQGF